MGIVVGLTRVDAGQWTLLPGLIVAGFGLGMTFAPLQTIAMRNIQPRMAGAASGFINTTRQLGAVIGSAAAGALLQVQLANKLTAAARDNAASLPAPYRDQFVAGFHNASSGSLEVGAGQSGVKLPPGIPEQVRQVFAAAAANTFRQGFTGAMRATLVLPLVVLALAALCCLFVKRRSGKGTEPLDAPAGAEATAHAT
jgi:hypothetical protein